MHFCEETFVKLLDSLHKSYIPQPARFKLDPPYNSYIPDFYLPEENIFYEIVGSRQAYSIGRLKYAAFRKSFPAINFMIANPDGTRYNAQGPRVILPVELKKGFRAERHVPMAIQRRLMTAKDKQKQALSYMAERKITIACFANIVKVPYGYLLRFLDCTLKESIPIFWDKFLKLEKKEEWSWSEDLSK